MIKEVYVCFSNFEEVKKFVSAVLKYKEDINIYSRSVAFDAKSLLGVMSISTGTPNKVEIVSDNTERIDKFIQDMIPFRQ